MTWIGVSLERRWWIPALLLVLVVSAVYLPTAKAGYVWDDDAYVTENANLQDGAGLARIWLQPRTSPQYYPLVFSSFWAERQLFGASATAHHVVNFLLHAANALLLWLVLKRLRIPAALLIALVFAVHPVHVESVAWVTERKNVLSGVFCLASLLAYLAFAGVTERRDGQDRSLPLPAAGAPGGGGPNAASTRRALYVLSLLLFACALLSKSVTATLPAVLLLLFWWQKGRVERRDLLALVPMFVLGIAFGAMTAWLEVHHVGAAGDDWTLSPVDRILLAGRVVAFYVGKLLWPRPLIFIYPRWAVDAAAWWQYLFPAGVLAGVAALWHWRDRLGRGPLVGALCFVGSLFPVLGFLNVYPMRYSWVADHFQYLPSIAFIALAIVAGRALLERCGLRWLGVPVGLALVLALGVAARAETRKFNGAESLWQDTIEKNPSSWIAHNNRGNLRMKEGRWFEAAAAFEAAIALKPDLAEAYNNLGTAHFYSGDTDAAIDKHRKAVELKPAYAEALNNLGVELASAGRHDEAMEYYRRALAARPDYAMAHYNLANALVRVGQGDAAEQEYRAAIRLEPKFAMAYYNLGVRLLAQGRRAEAGPLLGEAFRLKPDFAAGYYQVGNILLQQGDAVAATDSYARALQQKRDYPEAYSNLGAAMMRQGKVNEAIASFQEAIRLKPDYAIAENNLGSALEQQGNRTEALAHFEAAVRLDPNNAGARANLERIKAGRARGSTDAHRGRQ